MYWNVSSADTRRSLCEITCVIRGVIRPTLGTKTRTLLPLGTADLLDPGWVQGSATREYLRTLLICWKT